MTKQPKFSPDIAKCLQGVLDAHIKLGIAMTTMKQEDLGAAFEAYGTSGMTPLTSTFVGHNAEGKAMYDCAWWDEAQDDGSLVRGRAFVWYNFASGKICADT